MTEKDSPVDLTPEDIASVSPGYWASVLYPMKLANGQTFTFEGREYMKEYIELTVVEKVSIKATGGGFSEAAIIRSIHGMRYGRYSQGVGYYFPTDDDMIDYVKSRFNPLILHNRESIGRFMRSGSGGKVTDAASIKRIGNANLYMRGTTMKPGEEGGARQSTKTSAIHIDRAVLDEVDQMEADAIAKIRGRLGNACVDGIKGFHEMEYLGNPSDEDRGVDLLWQASDQRYWFRNCTCGGITCAELEFLSDPEKCVGFYTDIADREAHHQPIGYVRCVKCGKPVGIRHGVWIPQKPMCKTRAGFNWSHLTSEYHDPARILKDYRNPPEGNLGDVYRLDLGLAYSSQDDKLRKDMVWACCTNEGVLDKHQGPCAMGVDNDDKKHVVIGGRLGNEKYKVFKVCRVEDFKVCLDLVRLFNVKTCVVDIRPNKDSALEFQKACTKFGCRVFLCEYTDSILVDAAYNDDIGLVKTYRTGIFDKTHRLFVNNDILLPRRCGAIDEYALQCCNCVKSKEINKKTRQIIYRYKKTGGGNDHYRNSTNYFVLAANKTSTIKAKGFKRQFQTINEE